ncbi:MAG: DinB family protein, partial [Alphaproteobacteria bacterium]
MITPEYCRMMARYNAWQNRQLTESLDAQPLEVLTEDRGAFFGSILGTLNHLLWGDRMWMARFDPS